MRSSSPRLRRLDDALADIAVDLDAMLLSELDGYLAGPEPIPPEEWLPAIWGGVGEPFEDAGDVAWFNDLVVAHRDAIARTLGKAAARYKPVFDVDIRHGETLWEPWIEGFAAAIRLRPDQWAAVGGSGDPAVAEALAAIDTLAAIALDESDLERETIDLLTEAAPRLIPGWIDTLHAYRLRQAAPLPEAAAAPKPGKVGRNDPCPCGSGRKLKKCCGQG